MENLGTIVLAVGALGTASFGIVEALKWTGVGLFGFGQIIKLLGDPIMQALRVAYGSEYQNLIQAQYRAGRASGDLPRTIRQGARIGLTPDTAVELARRVGVVTGDALQDVSEVLQRGESLSEEQRGVLGRYELALDARIDAALALANSRYIGYVRGLASLVAIGIAMIVGGLQNVPLMKAFIVGLAAIPFAPMANDLAGALQAASKALPGNKK